MELERIEKLVNAGYTKAEIDAMAGGEAKQETETIEKQEVSPVDASLKQLTEIVNGLSNTVKEMQAANAAQAKTDKPSAGDAIKDTINSFIEKL